MDNMKYFFFFYCLEAFFIICVALCNSNGLVLISHGTKLAKFVDFNEHTIIYGQWKILFLIKSWTSNESKTTKEYFFIDWNN